MSNKFLLLAKQEIVNILENKYPDISSKDATSIALDIIQNIDWTNSALMHKDLSQIVEIHIRNKTF